MKCILIRHHSNFSWIFFWADSEHKMTWSSSGPGRQDQWHASSPANFTHIYSSSYSSTLWDGKSAPFRPLEWCTPPFFPKRFCFGRIRCSCWGSGSPAHNACSRGIPQRNARRHEYCWTAHPDRGCPRGMTVFILHLNFNNVAPHLRRSALVAFASAVIATIGATNHRCFHCPDLSSALFVPLDQLCSFIWHLN